MSEEEEEILYRATVWYINLEYRHLTHSEAALARAIEKLDEKEKQDAVS